MHILGCFVNKIPRSLELPPPTSLGIVLDEKACWAYLFLHAVLLARYLGAWHWHGIKRLSLNIDLGGWLCPDFWVYGSHRWVPMGRRDCRYRRCIYVELEGMSVDLGSKEVSHGGVDG